MRPLTRLVAPLHGTSTLVRALQVVGAVLFVVSLATGGKAYFQAFDATAPAGTALWAPLAIDIALFSAFALHHSVLARTRLKQWIHQRVGIDAERALYVILASTLFLACTQLWQPLPGTWYALSGAWWWVGAAVQAAGVLVTLLAARTLSLRELMGLDPSRQAAPQHEPPTLETRGLYRVVRHPIYFGWVLFVAGAPLMTHTRLLFAVVSVAYLVVAIPLEERSLIANFGDPYLAYRRRVRWRMVPGIY
jgi:protein-S-isoprenylcysteine O-methyltransferase Ste14